MFNVYYPKNMFQSDELRTLIYPISIMLQIFTEDSVIL